MTVRAWHVRDGDAMAGPFSAAEVLRAHLSGRYGADALVWTDNEGPAAWRKLSDTFPLERLRPPPLPAAPVDAVQDADLEAERAKGWEMDTPYGWRRYFARQLDTLLYSALMFFMLGAVSAVHDGFYTALTAFDNGVVLNIVGVVLATLPSAIVLGITGRSLGKLLFGLKVLRYDGRPPGLLRGLRREAQVTLQGLGLGIPIISLITMIMSYNRLHGEKQTAWDEGVQLRTWYRTPNTAHWFLMIIGIVIWVCMVVTFIGMAASPDA
ncbi:MAG: RDD family protein [Hyphomonadaceae bacterium]